jgi:hypothetical protein
MIGQQNIKKELACLQYSTIGFFGIYIMKTRISIPVIIYICQSKQEILPFNCKLFEGNADGLALSQKSTM